MSIRRIYFSIFILVISFSVAAQNNFSLEYYLPRNVNYDPAIPTPASVIGHEVGEWHVTHDKLVLYMKSLAAANPSRIKLQVTGTTYEGRQQLLLIITSPENQARINDIQKQHASLSDPAKSALLNTADMPAVLLMGFSIHGNESSGSNASMLTAYYLAAAQGPAVDKMLKEAVFLIDPSFNPDGLQRFSTWANQHKSKIMVSDPNSREFNEVWPGGRFNHYWFDLNRDWLPAVHRESRNRLQYFHDWRPNVLTDHHEMGSNSTFFFQPGVVSRVNPLTPGKNQELTANIAAYHAKLLDSIGSLYYTREGYDDFYYGKGSTFPDVQGSIGILFEQASSRGHVQETTNGLLTFPFTIRNQFITTLSTMEATVAMRKTLLDYQRDFFNNALNEAKANAIAGYVFGDKENTYNSEILAEMLQRHRIDVKVLNKDFETNGLRFAQGKSYFVNTLQPQYRLIRSIFEKQREYKDSLFYDVTAWTIPLAMGIPYAGMNAGAAQSIMTSPVTVTVSTTGQFSGTENDYAWVLDWHDFEAPKVLYKLLDAGLKVRVATQPFSTTVMGKIQAFERGSIIVPNQMQTKTRSEMVAILRKLAATSNVKFTGITTGLSLAGIDIGSNNAPSLEKPQVALLVGEGVSATDAGEVWHLMDQRMDMPLTQLEITTFNRADLSRYTTMIMVSGSQSGINKDKLKTWISGGGVLIACEDAVQWCSRNGISELSFKKIPAPITDSSKMLAYDSKSEIDGAQRMTGAIFRADIDLTHPLNFGSQQPYIDLIKTNSVFMKPAKNPFASPVRYGTDPLQSGFITRQNYEALKGTASVVVQTVGKGRVIHMADNPNFRAFWLGGMKMFMNAVFFGGTINAGSASQEEAAD